MCVCVKLGDHSAATVDHCIIRLMMITLSLSVERNLGCEGESSQFSKWKITDTDTIMKVCVKGCLRATKPLFRDDIDQVKRPNTGSA